MRTNKFRVWSKRRNNWLTGNDHSLHCSSNWMMDIFTGKIIDFTLVGEEYHPDPEPTWYMDKIKPVNESPFIVQQFSGGFDKNGKEIYEGDIIHFYDVCMDGHITDVNLICRYHTENLWFTFDESMDNPHDGFYWGELKNLDIEVIGNIFENPELLNNEDV